MPHRFAPAAPDEELVFGACRPGYPDLDIDSESQRAWIGDMQDRGIERVCCLLHGDELAMYDDWVGTLETSFGAANVRHAPIPDHAVIETATLSEVVLPFLEESVATKSPTVVHCSAGLGRTGHVLALWLAHDRGLDLETTVETVRGQGRRPLEAVDIEEVRAIL